MQGWVELDLCVCIMRLALVFCGFCIFASTEFCFVITGSNQEIGWRQFSKMSSQVKFIDNFAAKVAE